MRAIEFRGDYDARRAAAHAAGCAVLLQFHFNSGGGSYALTEINNAADAPAKALAVKLVNDAAQLWGIKSNGVTVLDPGERGYVCVGDELAGIILEPFFGDVAAQAATARRVQNKWADTIVARIRETYGEGAVIGLSLGHKYKTSNPGDRGASLDGGGDEASWNEPVLQRVLAALNAPVARPDGQFYGGVMFPEDGKQAWLDFINSKGWTAASTNILPRSKTATWSKEQKQAAVNAAVRIGAEFIGLP